MNNQMPAMPHGQPPIPPPPRRQPDMPYSTGPASMRSPPAYMGYPPHMSGYPPPPYSPHQYPQWYPAYPQMQPPPRPYQQPYGPLIVSSHPHSQPMMGPAPIPPSPLPFQPRTATPLQSTMSPPVGPSPAPMGMQEPPHMPGPVHSTSNSAVSASSIPEFTPPAAVPREPFRAPVSSASCKYCIKI